MFKVGDKVKVIGNSCHHNLSIGDEITLLSERKPSGFYYKENWYIKIEDIQKINPKNIMSSLTQKVASLFLQEPEKSFRKAEITDESGNLTPDGQTVFLTWLLKKNGDAFKTEVVDPILAEEKK